MVFFIKRNIKIREYKDFYRRILTIHAALNKLTPELDKAKLLLGPSGYASLPPDPLIQYLEKEYAFESKEFLDLDLTKLLSFSTLKKHKSILENVLESLKNYESFQGRIRFDQFVHLFNFERYIYDDKQFQYSIVSNYDKRIIPEFVSAALANMIYEDFLADEIRRNLEQYFVAIMANMDYHNYSHLSQVKTELFKDLKKEKNLVYIMGASSQAFGDSEYVDILNERLAAATTIINGGIETEYKTKYWKRKGIKYTLARNVSDSDLFETSDDESVLVERGDPKRPSSKLTATNLNFIYSDIIDRKIKDYNLFIVTSTFNLLKVAIEIERHFYNNDTNKPNNIIFIGDEKHFQLIHSRQNCKKSHAAVFHKKKIKSFLYELFMHCLDRNAVKVI
jgi:hypothetical protein